MIVIASLYIAGGLALAGLAVPMARRQIKPNPWYGFRTPRTLANPAVWYDANEYSGRMLMRAGFTTAALAVALAPIAFVSLPAYTFACMAVTIVSLFAAVVASFRYLGSIPR
jgi:uncharacterized membrane protein